MEIPDIAAASVTPDSAVRSYRVLVVTNLWPTEADPGYGSFVQAQMESLRALGVDYDVLYVQGRESPLNYLRGVFEVRRRLQVQRYDLIHAHFGLSGWVARFQRRLPLVVSFMGDDVLGRSDRRGRITGVGRLFQVSARMLARRADAVIVKSRQMKERLGLDAVHVIPNGVDLHLFAPLDRLAARSALGLDPTRKYVIFPYSPTLPVKRFDLIEEAVRMARATGAGLEILQVAGEPRERMRLYLNAADVLVLASYTEGSPNAVKEAMAVNLPVISVDVGDVAEVIGRTEGCFIVPPRADAIAARIIEVCRRGSRTDGRDRIAEHYSEPAIAKRILGVYASVSAN
ncbi:MAG TPA: glycosyltransferase [Terriglobia bacterium]|nr:glycosyltransferase [Terriglobia bacterium]